VRLVANDWPCLERPFVRTVAVDHNSARVAVTAETHMLKEMKVPFGVRAVIRRLGSDKIVAEQDLQLAPFSGMVLADFELTVPQPELWWPNGVGEQPLYEAEIILTQNGEVLDRLKAPFGIRTLERRIGRMRRTHYGMKEWTFTVNGKPMFSKGVNWMPIDALARVDPDDYEWHLSMAHDAGIQMIRIWGGGIIETDAFYDLCDKLGIMVWQDFPLTCGWKAEKIDRKVWQAMAEWTVFRLRNHPSLVFWCGGNEFDPDHRANADLVGMLARATRILDGTRPFMAASPDEGDIHGYPQWDASEAWNKILPNGPFISEWGSHGMPTAQTYREIVGPAESNAVIGPTLLKMDRKAMIDKYPEISHHWVEFQPDRLIQMLARGSAFDDLATVPLGRFSEAVAAGAAEFYKYSCEAARAAYPQNGGLLLWVWKRPWPIVGIQLVDGMGRPLAVYYDVKRAYSSPWPCLQPPQLNYVVGEKVEMPVRILAEAAGTPPKGVKVTARLVGPDLKTRQVWDDFPALDVPEGSASLTGPALSFTVPENFARAFFFVVVEIATGDEKPPIRNVYTFRCPPQLEDETFREQYRAEAKRGLFFDKGPWLRPQVMKTPTTLSCRLVSAQRENSTRVRLVAEVKNTGALPAVMTSVEVPGELCAVADDNFFWLEPGESRTVKLRVRTEADTPVDGLQVQVNAWNAVAQ